MEMKLLEDCCYGRNHKERKLYENAKAEDCLMLQLWKVHGSDHFKKTRRNRYDIWQLT